MKDTEIGWIFAEPSEKLNLKYWHGTFVQPHCISIGFRFDTLPKSCR